MHMACCYGNRDTVPVQCSLCGDVPEINPPIIHGSLFKIHYLQHTHRQHTTYCAWWTEAAGNAGEADTGQIQILAGSGTLEAFLSRITVCTDQWRRALG